MKLEFSQQIFEKYSNIKFHENASMAARMLHAYRLTNITELIIAFCNFVNVPTNVTCNAETVARQQ